MNRGELLTALAEYRARAETLNSEVSQAKAGTFPPINSATWRALQACDAALSAASWALMSAAAQIEDYPKGAA